MKAVFKQLPIEFLERGKYQPRQVFCPKSLEELAQSIQSQGLIEPLIVRLIAPDRYEIIAGERRWRAAQLAKLSEVPCVIGDYTNEQTAIITLVENIQREDLNLIEEAHAYQRLLDEFNYTQEEIAVLIGKSRSHIANLLRLLTLNLTVQEHIQLKTLSLGHARMLVGLTSALQETLAKEVVDKGWSVRKLEQVVRTKKKLTGDKPERDSDTLVLQNQLAEQVGSPVVFELGDNGMGWLKIKFYDNDTLTGLLERLGLSYD